VRSTSVPVEALRSGADATGSRLQVYPLGRDYPEFEDGFLVALTEQRDVKDIEWLCAALERSAAAGASEPATSSGAAGTQTPPADTAAPKLRLAS
jgi:hypothetical protein